MSKRKRKTSVGSGVRKNRVDKNCSRKGPAIVDQAGANFIRYQGLYRHPDTEQLVKAWELKNEKRGGRPNRKNSKPTQSGFTLFDAVVDSRNLEKLMLAASLKIKRVRRWPGYVLIKTYNLKNRPLEII